MAARLTEAEARALGITGVKAARKRTTRKQVGADDGPYRTRCTTCGEVFRSEPAEDRHIATTTHRRIELLLVDDPGEERDGDEDDRRKQAHAP
jgi:uncharacterized C2H2 Zn-finger protein